jgi:hypothetical protein
MILNYDKKRRTLVAAPSYNNEPDGMGRYPDAVRESSTVFSPAMLEESQRHWNAVDQAARQQAMAMNQRNADAQIRAHNLLVSQNQSLRGFQATGPTSAELLIKAEMIRRQRPQADFSRYEMHKDGSDFGAADFERGQIVGSTQLKSLPTTYHHDFPPIVPGPYYNGPYNYPANMGGVPAGMSGNFGDDGTDLETEFDNMPVDPPVIDTSDLPETQVYPTTPDVPAQPAAPGFFDKLWTSAETGIIHGATDPSLVRQLVGTLIPGQKSGGTTTVVRTVSPVNPASQMTLPGGVKISKNIVYGVVGLLAVGLAVGVMRRRKK